MWRRPTFGFRDTVIIACLSVGLWLTFFGVSSAAESVTSFTAEIELQSDSSFIVTETIVYDFGSDSRHGIYRSILNTHALLGSTWLKERYTDLSLRSVKRDGQFEPYQVDSDGELYVKIGNPNSTITGEHTYTITYVVRGGLSVYAEGVDLYWNVTGDEWSVPINDIKVVLRAAPGVRLQTEQYCYAGVTGASNVCDSARLESPTVAFFQQARLQPNEQLTIAQKVALPGPVMVLERWNFLQLAPIFALIWFVLIGYLTYTSEFKYRRDQTVIAQYEPYEDFHPMFTGVLLDNRLDPRDISGEIIYLAQQGFLSIKQLEEKVLFFTTSDHEITLKRPIAEAPIESQRKILAMLFKESDPVGSTVRLSAVSKNVPKQRQNLITIAALKKSVAKDMIALGFIEERVSVMVRVLAVAAAVISVLVIFSRLVTSDFRSPFLFFGVLIIYAAVCLLIASKRLTVKGYEARNYLKGFKQFLSVTEKERYIFHSAPAKNPQQFMEFLPFAIAFGVESEWAKVFKDIQMPAPDWYTVTNNRGFSVVDFNQELNTFTGSLASMNRSASSGSGSSGSSGGGSSGGGSGGGGGGSW